MSAQQTRRSVLIDLARKRQRPGSGSGHTFLRQRTEIMRIPDMMAVLGEILWAIVGAVATRLYMPERVTQDIDILALAQDHAEVQAKLRQAGFTYQGDLSIGRSSWHSPDGLPLDVIVCDQEWCLDALTQAQANRDSQGNPILPLAYLALMKFQAGRVQDLADVTRMLGQASEEQLATTRQMFARRQPDGSEDLESLIALGQLEMEL